jgi:hypothetical protein
MVAETAYPLLTITRSSAPLRLCLISPNNLCSDSWDLMFDTVLLHCSHPRPHPGMRVLHYVIGDTLFTGDTIFMLDFGTARCDFPG